MLEYSWKLEISRILHNSFAITWGILGVTIFVLLLITDYSNIPKELYRTMDALVHIISKVKGINKGEEIWLKQGIHKLSLSENKYGCPM